MPENPETGDDPARSGQPRQETNAAREEIALRAYRLWEERGCSIGSPQQDWLRAEAEMQSPSTRPVGVLLIPDRRWRTDAIKFLILQLNNLQRAFRYEFLPIPPGDLMIKRLHGRWARVSRDDVRQDCPAFLRRYHDYAARQCTGFKLADHTVPEKLILVSLARLSGRRYIVSEPGICVLGLGDWKKLMAPPSVLEFVLTLIIRLSVGLVCPQFLPSRHLGTKGCLFDFTIDLNEVKFKVLQGSICQQCRDALALNGHGGLVQELRSALSRAWIGKASTPGSAANIVANLGHDLFITRGLKPGVWQNVLTTLQREGTKELIKWLALILGTLLLVRLGLKALR